jgi:hypothetical protein
MIDEETLAALLAEHAERIPVPESAVGALLAEAPQRGTSGTRAFARVSSRALAAAVTVVVAAAAVWVLTVHSGGAASVATPIPSPPTSAEALRSTAGRGAAVPDAPPSQAFRSLDLLGAKTATPTGGETPTGGTAASTADASHTATAPTDTARVVRTGTLDLRIARHTFGTVIGRITTIAAAAGGFIADAQTFESAAIPSGTVTIRIPSARFNATVEQLRALGTVVTATTRGVDATGQYTDLQAGLQAATATRDQYLTVLARATNIGDILAVQDRIQTVQTQIDQLTGQIQELDNQTTYGTITISVNEPGPTAKPPVRPNHPSGISIAWANARNGFARRVEGLISHSGSALVILLGLLLVGGALRLLVPRMRRMLV